MQCIQNFFRDKPFKKLCTQKSEATLCLVGGGEHGERWEIWTKPGELLQPHSVGPAVIGYFQSLSQLSDFASFNRVPSGFEIKYRYTCTIVDNGRYSLFFDFSEIFFQKCHSCIVLQYCTV